MRADFDPAILEHVCILVPNESEFCALINLLPQTRTTADLGFDEHKLASLPEDLLHKLCRELGVPTVIVTLGARGCLVSNPQDTRSSRPPRTSRPSTPPGQGDAFVGAFAAALAEFGPGEIERAARFAQYRGGSLGHETRHGPGDAHPRRDRHSLDRLTPLKTVPGAGHGGPGFSLPGTSG